jgi:muramidase (phage lysozyme)
MALSSSLALDQISKSSSSLKSVVKNTTRTATGIGGLLSNSTQTKRRLSSDILSYKKRRFEIKQRVSFRERLTTPLLVSSRGGPKSLALSDTSTNISDRLVGFIGYLSAGWLLSNMPTWISLGEQFKSRLGVVGNILKNYGDESTRVMTGLVDVFGAALQNISRFDFSDSSGVLGNSLDNLKSEIDALSVGLSQSFDVLLKPFKNVPEPGTIQPDEPTQNPKTTPSSPGGGGGNKASMGTKEQRALLDAIAFAEGTRDRANGGYKTLFGGGQFDNYSRHPDKVIRSGGYASAAAGRYQFMPATFNRLAKKIGLKDFSPESQDRAALELVKELGVSDNILKKEGISSKVSTVLGKQWASFPGSPFGQPTKPLPSIQKAYQTSLGSPSTPPVAKQTPTPKQPPITGQRRLQKGDIFTKSLGKGVDYIQVTSLVGDGRNHGGVDIAAPAGTYIALRVDCEVVASGTYGDYGLVMDVWIPSVGIQLRMAHLSSVLIKSGKIPAGTSFARVGSSGGSTGPHIHLEYDTKKGMRGGGALNDDPANYAAKLDQYVRLLLLTKNPNKGKFSPASTPSVSLVPGSPSITMDAEDQVEMENNSYLQGLLSGITQERRGQKIVIIDDRGSVITPQVVSSSSGGDLQVQIPDSVLLNNFIKNKLLLDLNYL